MKTVNCNAKNPLTCRYHGQKAYEDAKEQLSKAYVEQINAKSQEKYEKATKDIENSLNLIDATDTGYAELQNAYMFLLSLKDRSWADVLSYQNRIAKAQELRAQDSPSNPAISIFQEFKDRVLNEDAGKPNGGIPGNYIQEEKIDHQAPLNVTELRKVLKNRRGGQGIVRKVYLNNTISAKGNLLVQPPSDGTPIVIYNNSGFNDLEIDGGRAIIITASPQGNSVSVKNGADVVVIARPHAKTTVEIKDENNSVLLMEPEENSRANIAYSRYSPDGERRSYSTNFLIKS